MIDLPLWDDSMSDGCSALPIGPLRVRRRVNLWLFAGCSGASHVCALHDRDYYYGGTRERRLASDLAMAARWEAIGVPEFKRVLAFNLIRTFGGPHARTPGVSWAFGGERFRYDAEDG